MWMKINKLFSIHANLIFLSVFLTFFAFTSEAQDKRQSNLRFVYIDHEPTLPSARVIKQIRDLRSRALENENALIIYMSSNESPIIYNLNVETMGETPEAKRLFGSLVEALNQSSHNKSISFDRKKMVEILSHIVDEKGMLTYSSVRLEFYLTTSFWKQGFNETILSPVFFALDCQELLKQEFYLDVYIDDPDFLKDEKGVVFGNSNWGNINKTIEVFKYYF